MNKNLPIVIDLDAAAREVVADLNATNAEPIRGTWAETQPATAKQVDEDDDAWTLA